MQLTYKHGRTIYSIQLPNITGPVDEIRIHNNLFGGMPSHAIAWYMPISELIVISLNQHELTDPEFYQPGIVTYFLHETTETI